MDQADKPVSKLKVARTWLLLLGTIIFLVVFLGMHLRSRLSTAEQTPDLANSVGSLLIGGFNLAAGVIGYLIVVSTNALTFDLSKPAWNRVKVRIYVANILVTVLVGLGLGFILSAFLSPVLVLLGFDSGLANILPLFGMLGLLQAIQLWVLIWSPMERRFIASRLRSQGITDVQLQSGFAVGLSNPASGTRKRFAAIEEDMGVLWVGPEFLTYRGDSEQLDIGRDQLVRMERRADTRSSTMLSGIAHIILHVRQADGSVREIRLHTEGLRTMGQKRRAMDLLADRIADWQSNAAPHPVTAA
ncbi:MAG TPA: hypothetical protein VMV72_06210 [Verrucomicrobiae bacterium]|nr:hypothetical protein [Verrucomicrobiae bacterium]